MTSRAVDRAIKATQSLVQGGAGGGDTDGSAGVGTLLHGLPVSKVAVRFDGIELSGDDELRVSLAAVRAMDDNDLNAGDDVLVVPVDDSGYVLVDGLASV